MRQKSIYGLLVLLLSCTITPFKLSAQISYGGEPWLQQRVGLRSAAIPTFVMPEVDTDALREEADLLRTNYFAHKFETDINLKEAAEPVVLSDGRRVWQVSIRSEGALSLNLLFTEYEVPEGASLFIYTAEQVVGRFDHRNNSPRGILPVRPLSGDHIVVEYSEPEGVAWEGKVTIGEVNHGFCDIFEGLRAGKEPKEDVSAYLCMPDALCEDVDEELIRSVVLLIINGNTACTGTLVNNTSDDETPYLLTAMHCLNTDAKVSMDWDYYVEKSGTIITFFNYQRSVCGSKLRGVEEMSMAITSLRAVIEGKDIALLELENTPPAHYNVYYAGWDMSGLRNQNPYVNLHHPDAGLKKYGLYDNQLSLSSYPATGLLFDRNSFWLVPSWTIGSTYSGSSGSPLFNREGLVIGTLTGGSSLCSSSNPNGAADYFSATYTGWETGVPENQLKTYLNPLGTDTKTHPGLDPNRSNPLIRLANADYNQGDQLVADSLLSPETGLAFGYNSQSIRRFVEEFDVDAALEVLGTYLYLPRMPYANTRKATIEVYEGTAVPETLLTSVNFSPQYAGYDNVNSSFGTNNRTTNSNPIESFVLFDTPVKVPRNKKLFVGYKLADPTDSYTAFVVYNTSFAAGEALNTAWIKVGSDWLPADQYAFYGEKTSLALQPLARLVSDSLLEETKPENPLSWFFDRETQSLVFHESAPSEGTVHLYSVAGERIGKVDFGVGDKEVRLPSLLSGTVGIVKIITRMDYTSGKIIY